MTRELKPCPFCGGKAYYWRGNESGLYRVGCNNGSCRGYVMDDIKRISLENVVEAWNTRSERTCKFESDIISTAWDENDNEIETGEVADEADMYCGNCGYPMIRDDCDGWWDEEPGPYGGRFLAPRFNYCPKCGSKVIDWDGRKAVS